MSTVTVSNLKEKVSSAKLFVASKTYCPYCSKAKNTLASYGITKSTPGVIILELDEISEGAAIQKELFEISGQKTVPNIYIGGKHIGGNSDLQDLQSQDKLEELLK
ncbi:glutaredoxin, partial [Nadsonia fulvescens var. elongata DSM 6958]